MDLIKVLSNPVKLQIMRYIQEKGSATTKEIAEKLLEVPTPTLYRHINTMIKDEILLIKEERKVRGSLERTIALNTRKMTDTNNEEIAGVAYEFLMNLYIQFQAYGNKENIDPVKDMLSMRTIIMKLTDETFYEFFQEWKLLIEKYEKLENRLEGKTRSISLISTPIV